MKITVFTKKGKAKFDVGCKRINLEKLAVLTKKENIECYLNELFSHSLMVKQENITFLMFASGSVIIAGNYDIRNTTKFLIFFEKKIVKKCLVSNVRNHNNRIKVVCHNCGKKFYRDFGKINYSANRKWKILCSKSCDYEWRKYKQYKRQ